MDVFRFVEVRRDSVDRGPRPYKAERRHGGFTHHVADKTRDVELSGAVQNVHFHVKKHAADRGPGHSVHGANARLSRLGLKPVDRPSRAEHVEKHFPVDGDAFFVLGPYKADGFAHHGGNLSLEGPDARLLRVFVDERVDGVVGEFDRIFRESVLLRLLGNQVPLRDLGLLVFGVRGELDDLEPVEKRRRNGVERVGGGDEEHVREVERNLRVRVGELAVLFAVQHLQKRGSRVASEIAANLVDLVQKDHRGVRFGLFDRGQNSSRHRADVGFSVAADLRLVANASQRDAHVLPFKRLRNRPDDGRFAGSGRSEKADNAGSGRFFHRFDRHKLDDPVLDLRESVVVAVENPPYNGKVDVRFFFGRPRKTEQEVDVHFHDREIRRGGGNLLHS